MTFNIITLMPQLVESGLSHGVVGSAFKKGLCDLNLINPRDFTEDIHKTIDDRPFGGGDGMLMMAEPLEKSLQSIEKPGVVIYLSPQGERFSDLMARDLAVESDLTFVCGRYGGVDQRFLSKNKIKEVSIGDFVISGGELAAMVVVDAVTRLKPGVLGHSASADQDSFFDGLLESPYYTRPQEWCGLQVPPILLSGDHKKIAEYKGYMSLVVTLLKRPDLVNSEKHDLKACMDYLMNLERENFSGLPMSKEDIVLKINEVMNG